MRKAFCPFRLLSRTTIRRFASSTEPPPVIRIQDATFYRRQPSATSDNGPEKTAIFPNLSFNIPVHNTLNQHWAIVGPSNAGKSTFLEILRGQHLCVPPSARSFPYLSSDEIAQKDPRLRFPGNAIQYVGFDSKSRGLSGLGTYMSARYESRREVTDFSVLDFLTGRTQLNAADDEGEKVDARALEKVVADLRLENLVDMPVSNLSNGQTRRARIAKALLGKPEVLLLDEPFMGLDPATTIQLSSLLRTLAESDDPRLLLALRPQDPLPEWITHVLFLGQDLRITHSGTKAEVSQALEAAMEAPAGDVDETKPLPKSYAQFGRTLTDIGVARETEKMSPTMRKQYEKAKEHYAQGKRGPSLLNVLALAGDEPSRESMPDEHSPGEPVIEMDGVIVKYGDKTVLGKGKQVDSGQPRLEEGLFWHVHRGQRWGVFGPNGSGKTTLIALLTSDHPQSYSLPLKLFSRSRLPTPGSPGIPLFELQRRIGHSSPETHAFFPRHLSVRSTLESAFAATPLSRPRLTAADDARISGMLRWFQAEINPSAGMNTHLAHEYFRPAKRERKEHVKAGNATTYRENYNKYWYEHAEAQEASIEWADTLTFRNASFSAQRVLLFLRAIVSSPDIIVLDEAFSGLDDWIRDKCLAFLEYGESRRLTPWARRNHWQELQGQVTSGGYVTVARQKRDMDDATFMGVTAEQAVICVAHVKEEVPASVRDWLFLPDVSEEGVMRTGRIEGTRPLRADSLAWNEVWGVAGRGK